MIQKDWDMINRLIEVVKELKSYTDTLEQIEVVRERLRLMGFQYKPPIQRTMRRAGSVVGRVDLRVRFGPPVQ